MPTLTARLPSNDDETFFGELPNPDPEDDSPRNLRDQLILLVTQLQKVSFQYNAAKKNQVFLDALVLNRADLFRVTIKQQQKHSNSSILEFTIYFNSNGSRT